jgi:hypothetical protein
MGWKQGVLGRRALLAPSRSSPKGFFPVSARTAGAHACVTTFKRLRTASVRFGILQKSHSKKYQFPSNNFDLFPGIGTYQALTRKRAEKKRRRLCSTNPLRKTISLCTAPLHACSPLLNAELCASRSSCAEQPLSSGRVEARLSPHHLVGFRFSVKGTAGKMFGRYRTAVGALFSEGGLRRARRTRSRCPKAALRLKRRGGAPFFIAQREGRKRPRGSGCSGRSDAQIRPC